MPQRQTHRLRLGRHSAPGATYFVTTCTYRRLPLFAGEPARFLARQAWLSLAELGDVEWLAVAVMPDHVHALFTLGARLTVSQTLGKAKATITRTLGRSPATVWQENAFEHRLRDGEECEAYGFYVFMNPYVAGLASMDGPWPGWACSDDARLHFLAGRTAAGAPAPEWLDRARVPDPRLVHGSDM
jgi:REP element-mobilizing transposase RayT